MSVRQEDEVIEPPPVDPLTGRLADILDELAAAVIDDRPKPSVHIGNELPRLQIIHAGQAHHVCHQGAGLSQDHDG
jgi:hypothetical protein